jgi:hypothetical protein
MENGSKSATSEVIFLSRRTNAGDGMGGPAVNCPRENQEYNAEERNPTVRIRQGWLGEVLFDDTKPNLR